MENTNNLLYRINGELDLNNFLSELAGQNLSNYNRVPKETYSNRLIFYFDTKDIRLYRFGGFFKVTLDQEVGNPILCTAEYKPNNSSRKQKIELVELNEKLKNKDVASVDIDFILTQLNKIYVKQAKDNFGLKHELENILTLSINDLTFFMQHISLRMMMEENSADVDFKVMPTAVLNVDGFPRNDTFMFFALHDSTKFNHAPETRKNLEYEKQDAFDAFKKVVGKKPYKSKKITGNFYEYLLQQYSDYLCEKYPDYFNFNH